MKIAFVMSLLVWLWMAGLAVGQAQTRLEMTVSNNWDMERDGELLEVPVSRLEALHLSAERKLVVYDSRGVQVPYQITHDGFLLVPVTANSRSRTRYTLAAGTPDSMQVYACGKYYPERMDDIAWENDKAAYRAYGPALQKSGEKAFGYDIFTKSVPYPVVEKRYALQLDSLSWAEVNRLRSEGRNVEADSLYSTFCYHVDHGNGMDCYSVGPTLGGGTNALLFDSDIIYPYCYQSFEILDNGPLRFSVRLTFRPFTLKDSKSVVETRVISLDKGSYLNRTEVTYAGLTHPVSVIGGIVIHPQNPDGYCFDKKAGYIAYADSTDNVDNDNGIVWVGAVFGEPLTTAGVRWFPAEERKQRNGALGHVVGETVYHPGKSLVYYWGSGWSKAGIPDMEAWKTFLLQFRKRLEMPLEFDIKVIK